MRTITLPINNCMDFTAFSHGQIQSKLWLCQFADTFISANARIAILGSWYNVLGLMMLLRNPVKYQNITGFDKDPNAIDMANKICESFMIQPNVKIANVCTDVNEVDLNGYQVVINCSVEHMDSRRWFDKLSMDTLVIVQSSNVNNDDPVWDIKDPTNSLEELKLKYPMTQYYFSSNKGFDYGATKYQRYMLIGRK